MIRPPDFRILTNEAGSRVEIAIHGELDLATAPQLQAEYERVAALEGLELAVVDLRKLAFLDSTGLEAIVKFESRSRANGVDVVLVRGPRAVERLFQVMQLDKKLRIVDDPAELG
jgi:anti-anti-sigma factor